ncbi:MAG: FkbM family methyltransferase [Scytonema sp. PMC 1069.18]|nr:FkbM family methyltransferase [Scytonema sp. PMC 1069.18]MEC4879937.1 FkbM family methyltransferase [Scytonema sp. PMC 1070.18]
MLSKLGLEPKNRYLKLHLPKYEHPIYARYQSSDLDVFYQIFVEEEYSVLQEGEDFKVILDCGANVGYSSIYLLNKYPHAHVIAVEPDEENFKVCQKNLSPYCDRVTLIRSAIWSHQTGLVIRHYGNGNEWGTRVEESKENEQPDLLALDILNLLEKSSKSSIDLLKMDVEGAETVIFSQNYENWLNRVQNIVIELHGKECENTFFQALSTYQYNLSHSGELTVCQKIKSQVRS